jgi:hypothetical protein
VDDAQREKLTCRTEVLNFTHRFFAVYAWIQREMQRQMVSGRMIPAIRDTCFIRKVFDLLERIKKGVNCDLEEG